VADFVGDLKISVSCSKNVAQKDVNFSFRKVLAECRIFFVIFFELLYVKHSFGHRNLSTRTSMFALVQQTILMEKTCKKSADILPRQGNLLQRNIFCRAQQNLFTTQNRLETS
jgi:hypothetical protein